MTKKHYAYLLATTLLAAPAIAQTSGSDATPTAPSTPGMTGSSTSGTTGSSASGSSAARSSMSSADVNRALAAPGANQMMASDIRGTRVYGANNENVGDISDILLAQNGQVVALVVGVGGFLGIGQKDVAIPFQAFEFVAEAQASTRTSTSTSTGATSTREPSTATAPSAPAPTSSLSGVSGTTGGAANTDGPAVTGTTPPAAATTTSTTGVLKPERIVLRGMTKADLEAAPQFRKTAATEDRSTPARTNSNR